MGGPESKGRSDLKVGRTLTLLLGPKAGPTSQPYGYSVTRGLRFPFLPYHPPSTDGTRRLPKHLWWIFDPPSED
nr:hypothetical protein Q903MT_gene362 [Picea sitchensis]